MAWHIDIDENTDFIFSQVLILPGGKSEVTSLAKSPQTSQLAVGYGDGTIKLFDLGTGQSDVTFQGHKAAVTTLAYDANGLRFVSGKWNWKKKEERRQLVLDYI